MPLSSLKVLELNEFLKRQGKLPLVENLCYRESENPEGIEIELRVGRVEKIVGESFLGIEKRNSPKTELIGDITDGEKIILMKPGDYFLVKTIEKINCPDKKIIYERGFPEGFLMPNIYPRTSLQRSGISLHCSITNPGYSGPLVFGLKNNSEDDFSFELGVRMFKLVFEPVIGEIKRAYSGQHQGGRMTSQGKIERQN